MPGLVVTDGGAKKRKRASATQDKGKPAAPRKRSKASPDADGESVADLEAAIRESQKHYNNIAKLVAIAREEQNAAASIALCRVFSRLQADGRLAKARNATSEKEEVITNWLRARAKEYREILLANIQSGDGSRAEMALTLGMQLVKQEIAASRTTAESIWKSGSFAEYCDAVLQSEQSSAVLLVFIEKYVQPYDDVRQHTFIRIADLASKAPSESKKANCVQLLSSLDLPDQKKPTLKGLFSKPAEAGKESNIKLNAQKKVAQQAWLSFMRCGLDKAQTKTVLATMTRNVVPWFVSPELLMDFLTDAFDVGGGTSLLALSGLFYLMQEKNLDYPAFYTKLYSLLDDNLLHSKHRSRFFRLMNTFLSSTHLPANLVASFIKRLSRLALYAPPAGIVAIIPWIYNMFKSHPACTFMMHRVPRSPEVRAELEQSGAMETYDPSEQDPNQTGAIDSCVWELVALQSHYHPNVASLAKIISEQFTKASYNLEDFLDHSYNTLIEAELGSGGEVREVKKTPVVEYDIPKKSSADDPNPPVSAAELVAQLDQHNENVQRLAAFKLQDQMGDPSFADQFAADGGMPKLQALMLKGKGNTLAYILASFSNLLALDQGWDWVSPDLTDRLVELVLSPSVNVQRASMRVLVHIVNRPRDSPQSTNNYSILQAAIQQRPAFYDTLVNTLSSSDHGVCAITISLINALTRDALASPQEDHWAKFAERLQGLGLLKSVYTLMQSATLIDLNGPLLEYQYLHKILLRKWRDVPFDLSRQDHRRALKTINAASKARDELSADESTRVEPSRWKRLGFSAETPEAAFAETGYLGMSDLLDYVRSDEDAFQRLMLEQSKKPEQKRCPIAEASLAITSILYAHFEANEANEYEQTVRPHLLQWPRLHAAGIQAFFRLWASTGAEADDFVKIQELVRVLVEQVVSLAPRTSPIEKLEERMATYSVQQLRELQMGLLEMTHDEALGHHIREIREDLRQEATQFMREQRTRCLLRGAWFPNTHHAATAAGAVSSWRFARLSHNRRHLHYDDFPTRASDRAPALDELDLRLDLSLVSQVVSNIPRRPASATSTTTHTPDAPPPLHEIVIHGYLPPSTTTSPIIPQKATFPPPAPAPTGKLPALPAPGHARTLSARSGLRAAQQQSALATARAAGGKEVPLLTLHATSDAQSSEWFDGLLLLLNQTPVTQGTDKMVQFIADYGLKMRLLNVRFEEALGLIGGGGGGGGADRSGRYGRKVDMPDREGVDDEFYYDVGVV
ncbi:hypothetical protein FH972_024263 [Carpinus fangiana]|uniref:ELMO domain-containing protein n=1 Tax=Carpinus fangiana TaxID=176857 RepID=A0A5N6KY20_9ROSI|nr:hypothetical protein FH972_024263 [Carpinus fangiana]